MDEQWKKFWKNSKKFVNNFSLISSIDRLDNGVIFIRKKEGERVMMGDARAVCSKFEREEVGNSEKSKKLQNFEILPKTNGHF